ncbi:MAG: hypothetical protein WCB36_05505 [Burkholderiales bacterium]
MTPKTNIFAPNKTPAEEILVGMEYQSSQDLKAFYQKYRHHSLPGVKYWVYNALGTCLRFAKGSDGKPYQNAADFLQSSAEGKQLVDRTEAYNKLHSRCNGLETTPVNETVKEVQALQESAEAGGDAKALMARGLLINNKYSEVEIAQALVSTLESEDPYAIRNVANLLQRPGVDYILIGVGNHPVSYELVSAAANLAACELGADCSTGSITWAEQCINDGNCSSPNVAQQILDRLDSDADRLEAQRARDLIVKAAKTGDVSLLGLPK